MNRKIIITHCEECPWFNYSYWDTITENGYCSYNDESITNIDITKDMPDWCPLDIN